MSVQLRLNFKWGLGLIGGEKCDDNQDPSLPKKIRICCQHLLENCSVLGFWAVISYGHYTPLIPLRKRTKNEKKSENDKLSFDSHQYTHEVLSLTFCHSIESAVDLEKALRLLRVGL
jgi:hypothetical protein